jgi:hypothetical protein
VEFRLLYEGELLPSAGTNKRTAEKHAIRRAFHPQLRRLWNTNSNLISWPKIGRLFIRRSILGGTPRRSRLKITQN